MVLFSAPTAGAHGPSPAAVELVTASADLPTFIKLSQGAALFTGHRWEFMCPTLWGDPESPLMGSADNQTVWVAGKEDLYVFKGTHAGLAQGQPDFNSSTVRAFVTAGDQLHALVGFSQGSTIWRLAEGSDPVAVYQHPTRLDSVVGTADGFAVLEFTGDKLLFTGLAADGTVAQPTRTVPYPYEGTPVLRVAGSHLFIRTQKGSWFRLLRLEADDTLTELAASEEPIHGPVALNGTLFLSVDRHLSRLEKDDSITRLDDERLVRCLDVREGVGLISCVLPSLYRVEPNGSFVDEPLWSLAQLTEPDLRHLGEEQALSCKLQWLDLISDAGLPLDFGKYDPAVEVPVPTAGGCQTALSRPQNSGSNALPIVSIGLLLLLTSRRRG